jgi:hypothetical protein
MRRSRRGGISSSEFGGSGEDSFVAVVVTKLTGALLFILLLTMVIMALLPKAVDVELAEKNHPDSALKDRQPLKIATPTRLPEAIAGRAYLVALAATGGGGPLRWTAESTLPEWLSLDESSGRLAGTPPRETAEPLALAIEVTDGREIASQPAQLLVLPFQAPSSTAAWLKRHLRIVPWKAWLEQGVGFLVLWLVHLLGMNMLANLERSSLEDSLVVQGTDIAQLSVQKRFTAYRLCVRLTTLSAMIALAVWLLIASGARH